MFLVYRRCVRTTQWWSTQRLASSFARERSRGAAIRSRVRNIDEGEKCMAYFLGLEKSKRSRCVIRELFDASGASVSETAKVARVARAHFAKAFGP